MRMYVRRCSSPRVVGPAQPSPVQSHQRRMKDLRCVALRLLTAGGKKKARTAVVYITTLPYHSKATTFFLFTVSSFSEGQFHFIDAPAVAWPVQKYGAAGIVVGDIYQ